MSKKKSYIPWKTGLVLLLVAGAGGYWAWQELVGPGAGFKEESKVLYLPSGSTFETVVDSLLSIGAIDNERGFRWLSAQKQYVDRVKPGRYRIDKGMSMNALLNRLRSGEQEPIRLTFSNIKRLQELAGKLGRELEPDSLAFLREFRDEDVQAKAGADQATFIALFIPDTYELWWTTTPAQFVARMQREHDAFWEGPRRQRAKELGLSTSEVSTLASIVQAETVKMSDAPIIAGVYLNRLRKGMPLQADPTLKFALGLDSIGRVLDRDKDVASPYNTYQNRGLPPGPICMAETRFIDSVLNAETHDYYYFCARADLSGHSDFSKTYEQHLVNARRYQRALNERKIYR
ncbi:MAG: endolytic transglycosylase MltG [Flavobacteriales bacterium]|nr:endolytic transglycosylase MltG [Flavobacteriales bacterium]